MSAEGDGDGSRLKGEIDLWLDAKFEGLGALELPSYRDLAHELERVLIRALLARFDGKLARMAGALKANRTTLRKRLREGEGEEDEG